MVGQCRTDELMIEFAFGSVGKRRIFRGGGGVEVSDLTKPSGR